LLGRRRLQNRPKPWSILFDPHELYVSTEEFRRELESNDPKLVGELLRTTKLGRVRSFAEEGTVYWLIVSAILLGYLTPVVSLAAGPFYFTFTIALAIVELVLAYACWTLRTWGFLASTLSAIVVAGLAFGILYSPIGDLLLLLQLQVVLFAYRAHREPRQLAG
jgi:hypothetical protein